MPKFTSFSDLDNEGFFTEWLTDYILHGSWSRHYDPVGLTPVVDADQVKRAYQQYQLNLQKVRVMVHSQDPNHLKRGACLLEALTNAETIADWDEGDGQLVSSLEQSTALGLSHDDCQHRFEFVKFLYQNGKYLMAIDLTFRCCQVYEQRKKSYDFNYLEHFVRYLSVRGSDVETVYMMLSTFWQE